MESLENIIINRYLKNLEYLEKADIDLYNKINYLSTLIENGQYPQRFEIEYDEQTGFDIYDSVDKCFLYDKRIEEFDKTALEKTNFDKGNSLNLFAKGFYNIKEKLSLDGCDVSERGSRIVSNDISEFTNIFKKSTEENDKKFLKINKFYFLGTLLGSHIYKIHKKIKANTYFICEKNLEIFRLSLFINDYYKMASDASLVFSIMDNDDTFNTQITKVLAKDIQDNYMVKYFSTQSENSEYIEKIYQSAKLLSPFKFQYPIMLNWQLSQSFKNINRYKTLQTKKRHTVLNGKPVLIVAAGPSFEKYLPWIKENSSKFCIVAIGAVLIKLYEQSITPDIIVSVDPEELVLTQFPKSVIDSITDDTPILLSTMTHESVLASLNNKNIYLYEVTTAIKNSSVEFRGASVSEVSLYLSYFLGAREIFFLGVDLALNQETGDTHFKDYIHGKKYSSLEDEKVDTKYSKCVVKGNFKEQVLSIEIFQSSIYSMNKATTLLNSDSDDLKIYNLSEGAYIQNTIPLKIEDINISTFKELPHIELKNYLENESFIGLDKSETLYIEEAKSFLDTVTRELSSLKKIKVKNYDSFIERRASIFNLLIGGSKKYQRLYMHGVFRHYIQTMEHYFGYWFNDVLFNKNTSYIKRVKNIWCEQLIRICEEYKFLLDVKGS